MKTIKIQDHLKKMANESETELPENSTIVFSFGEDRELRIRFNGDKIEVYKTAYIDGSIIIEPHVTNVIFIS